jgi:hypothetical protein
VVSIGVEEDLRLVLEAPEGLGVNHSVPIPFERCPELVVILGLAPAPALVGLGRGGGQELVLELFPLEPWSAEQLSQGSRR